MPSPSSVGGARMDSDIDSLESIAADELRYFSRGLGVRGGGGVDWAEDFFKSSVIKESDGNVQPLPKVDHLWIRYKGVSLLLSYCVKGCGGAEKYLCCWVKK